MKNSKGLNKKNIKKGGEFMKRFLILAVIICASMALASSAFAGITATRHNLSSARSGAPTTGNSGGTVIYSTNQDQLCVWCHTPHAGATGGGAPLWNKSITGATFTVYPTTVAGTAPATTIYNGSRICLTCHDGTLAINQVINAPGSGGVNSAGSQVGAWQGTAAGNIIPTSSAANLGNNISNDHPVSIEFSAPSAVTDNNPASLRVTTYALASTTTWLARRTVANPAISDILVASGGGGRTYIECVTCHDPHTEANATFLRATTTASRICLTCHDK